MRDTQQSSRGPAAAWRWLGLAGAGLAAGCAGLQDSQRPPESVMRWMPGTQLAQVVPANRINSTARQVAREALSAFDAKDYRRASDLFNLALKTDPGNSHLHVLNALAYQMRAVTGESALLPLAEEGLQAALRFDPGNWMAHYYAGVMAMDQRDAARAQQHFATAALYVDDRAEVLYDLAIASYYAQDPRTAAAALEGLRRVDPAAAESPHVLQAMALVHAALDEREAAAAALQRLQRRGSQPEWRLAQQRTAGWSQAWDQARMTPVQFRKRSEPAEAPAPAAAPAAAATPAARAAAAASAPAAAPPPRASDPSDFLDTKMASVDVAILSTEEDDTNGVGINLLDGLKLQFGNPLTQTLGFSRTTSGTRTLTSEVGVAPRGSSGNTVITRAIGIPALSYDLNIANSTAKRNEVLARPTLVALANQTSTFFSGVDVVGAAVSGGQGGSVQIQKEVGVKMSITPEFLPGGLIKLNVIAERTFLAIPSTSVKFDFRLDTSKTIVNANVVMRFGETLILSGLSERDSATDRNATPGLDGVPGLQYLFSRSVNRSYSKSILILLTPRRAQFTERSASAAAAERAEMSAEDRGLQEFEARHQAWFKPIPNIGSVMEALQRGRFLREFRSGDMAKPPERTSSAGVGLAHAVRMLYD